MYEAVLVISAQFVVCGHTQKLKVATLDFSEHCKCDRNLVGSKIKDQISTALWLGYCTILLPFPHCTDSKRTAQPSSWCVLLQQYREVCGCSCLDITYGVHSLWHLQYVHVRQTTNVRFWFSLGVDKDRWLQIYTTSLLGCSLMSFQRTAGPRTKRSQKCFGNNWAHYRSTLVLDRLSEYTSDCHIAWCWRSQLGNGARSVLPHRPSERSPNETWRNAAITSTKYSLCAFFLGEKRGHLAAPGRLVRNNLCEALTVLYCTVN